MTLFTVPMNNFLVKADGDNKTYIGMDFDAGRISRGDRFFGSRIISLKSGLPHNRLRIAL